MSRFPTDRIALSGIQEGYKDVLKEALEDERAENGHLRERLEETEEELDKLRADLKRTHEEKKGMETVVKSCNQMKQRSKVLEREHEHMSEECYKLRMDTAMTTEKVLQHAKVVDSHEEAMKIQLLALKERLTSSQTANARDRAQLQRTIEALTADLQKAQKRISTLERESAQHDDDIRHTVEQNEIQTLQQVEPYRQLNARLMEQLAVCKEENARLASENISIQSVAEQFNAENIRLKEAQRMLTVGWSTRQTRLVDEPIDVPVSRLLQLSEEESPPMHFPLTAAAEPTPPPSLTGSPAPPDSPVGVPADHAPPQEHVEALEALKASLSDVRGLIAKRAKRRQSQ
eukprot:TRINITY_DN24358_c0_g1_i1.p1 TRINITY_DN24358_c0_g1~~TRINITY_DN24358_c0_g1_i1.p1  ORF type:complete len:362 (+),score=99.45 TRINITY_DN24358_c0_g1_i1:51-1088(+)